MFRQSLRALRFHWRGLAATFVVIFVAGAIMTAAGSMMETGLRAVLPAQRLAAAPIVVAGDSAYEQHGNPVATLSERVRVDISLAQKVAAVDGVDRVVLDHAFPATALAGGKVPTGEDELTSFGHGWESAQLNPYRLVSGEPPAATGQVVLDSDVADRIGAGPGDKVDVLVRTGTEKFLVTGVAEFSGKVTEDAVFFSPADVRRFVADPAKADAIAVLPVAGTDQAALVARVEQAIAGAGAVALTGDDRGKAEYADVDMTDLILIGGILGGLSILVGLLGVASTLSLSFQQRHKEMALLRAVGATPKQVRRMIMGETVAVSLLATVLSAVPGLLAGKWLFEALIATGIAPSGFTFYQSSTPTIIAATLAILTSVGASIIAGRRSTLTKPTEALTDDSGQRYRLGKVRPILAVVCFGLSGMLMVVAMTLVSGPLIASPSTFASVFFASGLALLGPSIAKGMTTVIGPVLRVLSGLSGKLATLNLQNRAVRLAAVTTPIMLLTGIATANLYLVSTESSVKKIYTQTLVSDAVYKAGPAGVTAGTLEQISALPEVGAASDFVASTGFVESPEDPWGNKDLAGWQLLGYTGSSAAAVGAAREVEGSLTDLTGKTVALAANYATELKAGLGDQVTIRMGDGAAEKLTVVALVEATEGFEAILLPAELLASHVESGMPSYVVVSPKAGVSDEQLAAALGGVAAGQPGAEVVDRDGLTDAFAHHLDAQALVSYLLVGTLLGYITISVLNSTWLAIRGRTREFALQRLTGSTRAQVVRMMAAEGAGTALIGILLGTVVAPATLIPFSLARADSLTPSGPVWMYLAIVGFATVLTVGATLLPTWQVLKVRPVEAAAPA
ncbi:ABC transporter permease [Actinoplanes subglobosus]|uniref:ABC transporter permease n=1 Tax=Actinoplanes subglobosus TaxID=1547892 RepID=A0ABV8J3Q0_9ACTN